MRGDRLIHSRFDDQVRSTPDAIALSSGEQTLSYGQLSHLADQTAVGVARVTSVGAVVGILARRGPEAVVAALACARAGRPFVMLDLGYPAARLQELMEMARPALLLLAGEARLPPLATLDLPVSVVDLRAPDWPSARESFPAVCPDAPAYLLFTSGSTGAPKCVACSHHPLVNFVAWQAKTFDLTNIDRFTLLSGLSHDPLLRDIFTPLSLGATLHIPTQATLTGLGELGKWFEAVQPTVAHMTPPLGHLLTAGRRGSRPLQDLRYVFWGGDALTKPLVDALARIAPACQSVNFYGSTETPQAASFYRVPRPFDQPRAPVGVGIDGFALEIRSEADAAQPAGAPGEIVVRSRFLTLGYVEQGQLPPPRGADVEQSYATGDIGHLRADGQVAIQGRRDDQVKVRGYRVEMAEVTAAALKAPGVAQAITLNVGAPGEARLCCFIQADVRGEPSSGAEVQAVIARLLPSYMVPDTVEVLSVLPLLPNGKIDRQALIASQTKPSPPPVQTAVGSPVEVELVKRWVALFPHKPMSPQSTFAALGGDSLSYVNAYLAAEEVLGSVPEAWTTMTVSDLAATAEPAARQSLFGSIESAILMRAVAISAVVASHFGLVETGGGATSALLWVSGFLFGGLQLREVDHHGDLKPLARLLRSILVPLLILEIPQFLAKLATHHSPRLSSVLMYVDLLDYTGLPSDGPGAYGGVEFMMWYIHCVIHIVLIYGGVLLALKHLFKVSRPALVAAVAVLGLGLIGRFVLPGFIVPDYWSGGLDPMSFFNHAPTAHLATFALAALAGATRGRVSMIVLGATLLYALLSTPIFGAPDCIAIVAVAALIALLPRLPFPRLLSMPVYVIAGASFFIYLLHFKFLMVFTRLHLPIALAWAGALVGGVGAWRAWNWSVRRASSYWASARLSLSLIGFAPHLLTRPAPARFRRRGDGLAGGKA